VARDAPERLVRSLGGEIVMDNQHRRIFGYRELTERDIELINELKRLEGEVLALASRLHAHRAPSTLSLADERWRAIGITDIEKGFMALVRSVARPGDRGS